MATRPPAHDSRPEIPGDPTLLVLDSSAFSPAAVLRRRGDDLHGELCARTLDRSTPDHPATSLAASFIVCGDYVVRRELHFQPHAHPSFELNLVRSGRWRCRMQGVDVDLFPGDAVLAQPGELHEDRVEPGTRYRGLRFALHRIGAGDVPQPLLRCGAPPRLRLLRGVATEIDPIFDRLQACHDPAQPLAGLVQDAQVLELAWRLAGRLPFSELEESLIASSRRQHQRQELLAWFQAHAADGSGVDDLAQELGLSQRTLRQRCQACFGQPPARALMHVRLSQARRLLSEPGASVSTVSASLGFRNPFHFSRAYRQHFGIAPSRDT